MTRIPPLQAPPAPWYREPWPWLLMAGPAAVVVAGVVTTVIAFRTADGLVADDYYKRGLAINRVIQREEAAAARHMRAEIAYDAAAGRVRVLLAGSERPPALTLTLVHPTRAGMDRKVVLRGRGGEVYESELSLPRESGRWSATLETADWRLAGVWGTPAQRGLALGGAGG